MASPKGQKHSPPPPPARLAPAGGAERVWVCVSPKSPQSGAVPRESPGGHEGRHFPARSAVQQSPRLVRTTLPSVHREGAQLPAARLLAQSITGLVVRTPSSFPRKSFRTLSGYLDGFHGYGPATNGERGSTRGGRGGASGGPMRGGFVAERAGSGAVESPWGRPWPRPGGAGRRWAVAGAAPGASPSRRTRMRTSRW